MAPPTRDFAKRPKAKVGKRAPSKLNATDTSFKTASVAVRPQQHGLDKNKKVSSSDDASKAATSAAAARMELVSSHGNALSTLQASLRHHAAPVRASGLKGIRDAVQSLSSLDDPTLGTSILEANLPSLLPNMCRCWLDDDDDVRSLAIQLFGDILSNLSSSMEQYDLKCLAPFVPFLCAYASSALNSLDRSIRKDGALIVGMLASSESCPSFASVASSEKEANSNISAMSVEMGKHVDLFIPSVERLLSSMSLGGRGKNAAGSKDTKKRKRDGRSSNSASSQSSGPALPASDSTLISLALLLRASLASKESTGLNSNTSGSSIERRLDPSLLVSGECTFLRGGSAHANSLLIFRGDGSSHRTEKSGTIRSILDLPTIPSDDCAESSILADEGEISLPSLPDSDTTKVEKIQRLTSLLETLRMKFVELTHSGRKSDNPKVGLFMSAADIETVDVLVQSIRLVHHLCQSYQALEDKQQFLKESRNNSDTKRQSKKRGSKKTKAEDQDMGECLVAYQTAVAKTLELMLETFPICPMDGISTSRYELTNAGICSLLAELGGDSMFETSKGPSSPQWINAVFSYILPRLNSTNATDEGNGIEEKKQISEGIATNMLLKVVSKLLLPYDSERNYLLNNPLKRHELLQAFAGAFFPRLAFPSTFDKKEQKLGSSVYHSIEVTGVEDGIKQLAPTAMGKTAAMLLVTLIKQSADSLLNPTSNDEENLHEKNCTLLLQMASVLPIYLLSWEAKFPVETGKIFASFISLVRQWPDSSGDNTDGSTSSTKSALRHLCLGLRSSLDGVYLNSKKKLSIFERLPEQVQKLCVGLIGLLKCPSGALTKSLSSICAKSSAPSSASNATGDVAITNNMAIYIMEVMHMLRKTMPMPNYLTFLIDSCGIKHASMLAKKSIDQNADAGGTDPLTQSIFYYDKAIAQLSRFLTTSCDGASTKVLPMVRPILQKWLSPSNTADDIKQMVQARAAVSVLSAFTLDEVLTNNSVQCQTEFVAPKFLKLDDEFDKLVITSILDQFDFCAKLWSNSHYMDDVASQQVFLARLLGPTTLLLRYRSGMLEKFVQTLSSRVIENGKTTRETDEDAAMNEDEEEGQEKRINATEVHMNALLLVLKSKDPISMTDLIRDSEKLLETLLATTEDMEKSVAGGHLAHLGSKLVHQARLCKQ